MRCFLAIELPEDIKARLQDIIQDAKRMGLAASFCKPEQLHITLLFLGEKPDVQINTITEKMAKLQFPRFDVSVGGAGFFPSENYVRVFWAGAETRNNELQQLHNAVCSLLGEKPEKNFVGHITLARIKGTQNISELKRLKNALTEKKFGEFVADAVVLKKSVLTPAGAAYEDLNTFPLK